MSCLGNSADRSFQRHWALPPGIRPGDCDGPAPAPADADADQFWAGCAANLRERIATQFARARVDEVRDAILDAQMPARVPAHAIHQAMGAVLWRAWIGYRDRVLEQLQRRGQFDLELPQER